MKKKSILLDVDEVIVFSGFVEAVNAFLGTNYVIDDFTDYYIDDVAIPKDRMGEFNEFLNTWNLYEHAEILPGSVDSLKRIGEYYDIYLLTACINPLNVKGSSKVFVDKYNFLLEKFPFLDPKKFIFTSSKNLFKADVKIDNLLSNFTKDEDIDLKIMFPSYHNKEVTDAELAELGVIRAGYDWKTGWNEVEKILLEYIKQDNSINYMQIKK